MFILPGYRRISPPVLKATPIATTPSQPLSQSFFARPAEQVAPELIGCLLVKRQPNGELLWGVLVETEAYSQDKSVIYIHQFAIYYSLFSTAKTFQFWRV